MQLESTAVADYSWIWIADDALAWPEKADFPEDEEGFESAIRDFATEFEAALESGDMSRVPIKPGMSAAIWTLAHLRGQPAWSINEMSRSGKKANQLQAIYDSARASIVSVEGFTDAEGVPLRIKREHDEQLGCKVVQGDMMAKLCDCARGNLITAIGFAALKAQVPKKKH